MPPADDSKRKAAKETIDILYEISTLLVSVMRTRFFSRDIARSNLQRTYNESGEMLAN